ncbi:MAG: virginiamycin lyase, partial [Patescibacteria group bacterium]|nr:virginiamycin lyase [Patescibacteria group bacterium]
MERVFKRATKLISGLIMLAVLAFGLLSESTSAVALEYEFYTPPSETTGVPSMALGPDGNMWFVKLNQDKIGKVTPEGMITEYELTPGDGPLSIAAGPDGNMWFTAYSQSSFSKKIGKITMSGSITFYDVSADLGP